MINDWKEVSINLYNTIIDIQRTSTDDDFIFEVLGLLMGKSLDDVLSMPYNEVQNLAKNLQFLSKKPTPNVVKREYKLGNRVYRTQMDFTKITTAQYIDFQMVSPHASEDVVSLLAILLVPKGCTYNNGYSLEEAKMDIGNHLSIEDALGLSAFFLRLYRIYIGLLQRMMKRQMRKLGREMKKGEKYSKEQMEAMGKIMEATKGLMELL